MTTTTTTSAHELDALLLGPALASPDALAIDAGAASLTYAQLRARALRLSGWLRAQRPHGRVGVLCGDPALAIPALLACLDAGWTYAPLDPAWPAARLRAVAEELAPDALLVERRTQGQGEELRVARRGWLDEADALPDAAPARAHNPGAANVFFTSGTTGRPKGILGRPGAAAHYVAWEARVLGFGGPLRVSALAPTSFDASLRDALLPLSTGGAVCVPPDRAVFADGARLGAWLAQARVEVIHTVPTVLRALLAAAPTLPALKAVLLAGEPLRPSDVARFWSVFPEAQVALYNLYGPTETTMTRLCHRATAEDAHGATVPLGLPMDDTEVFVLDSSGKPRGVGRPGEIVLRTRWAALGYLNRAEETERGFVPDLLGDGDPTPCYRTGDLGVLREDGALEFRGRRDLQVKVRGVRVELEEVEAALGAVPGVEAAAAALRDGPDGEPRLAAWFVGATTPQAVRAALELALPSAAVPSYIGAVEALPRLINGKVDRSALRVQEAEPGPQVAPQGWTEERVAQVLRSVLGGALGAQDDVFSLGMSSLQAIQALWRLNEAFGAELPIDLLYRARTVQALGAQVERLAREAPSAAPFELSELRAGDGPLTFWLPPAYGLTLLYRDLLERVGGAGRAVGLDLARPLVASVEGMARAALDQLRRVQPQGPYRLAGWSFGGVLAFELARQLGPAQVERLLLLDSAAPGDAFDFEAGDAETAALAARKVEAVFGVRLDVEPDELRGKDALALCELLIERARSRGVPLSDDLAARARAVVEVRQASMAAWRAYRPSPYEGSAWIARAADAPADWTQGWDRLITGGLARRVVPGTHVGMLEEPRALADALAELLG